MSVGMTQLPIIPQITKYVFLLCICIKTIMEPDTIMYTMWQQSKEYPLPSVTIKYALRNIPKLSIRWQTKKEQALISNSMIFKSILNFQIYCTLHTMQMMMIAAHPIKTTNNHLQQKTQTSDQKPMLPSNKNWKNQKRTIIMIRAMDPLNTTILVAMMMILINTKSSQEDSDNDADDDENDSSTKNN